MQQSSRCGKDTFRSAGGLGTRRLRPHSVRQRQRASVHDEYSGAAYGVVQAIGECSGRGSIA